jgi:tetratricopeptide (TPR) repeat protein
MRNIEKGSNEIYTYITNLPCQKYRAPEIPIIIIFNVLILTESKGAFIGLIFALSLIITYFCFEKFIKPYRKIIFVTCISLFIAGSIAVAWYGLKHDRLPGGNSMLVRWQYWRASAKMYADHPLTGVGPGNFTSFYSHYKPAAALESVSDPHNFPLSILTQYGPLGLAAMLAMIFVPLWKIIFPKSSNSTEGSREPPSVFKAQVITFMLFLWLGVLLVRQFLIPAVSSGNIAVLIYIVTRFIIPALVVFIVSFMILRNPNGTDEQAGQKSKSFTVAILFCAVLGFALHNLTDFAFFEPGVYTTFWFMLACLVAINSYTNQEHRLVLKPSAGIKIMTLIAVLGVGIFFIECAIVPLASSTVTIEKANYAISQGRFERANNLLGEATVMDKLSPLAPSLNARLYLHFYRESQDANPDLLVCAEECLKTAIERNISDFKNYERLTEVYLLMSEQSAVQEKNDWLNKAFSAASDAVELYPGCDRLHFNLAQIAEMLDKTDIALKEYKKTIEIEEQYRDQFRVMFPKMKKIVSRLGEDKYQHALVRVKELSITSKNNPGDAI